jgi:hypothetical protein
VVVVAPLGSFLSSKTAADTAARLASQFGNSVSCTGAGREGPSWCFFHCLESPCCDMESPGTALIAAASDFPSRRWVKAIDTCRSVFPDLAPFPRTLFLGIVNLQRNRRITIKKFQSNRSPPITIPPPPVRFHRPLDSPHQPSGHLSTPPNSDTFFPSAIEEN